MRSCAALILLAILALGCGARSTPPTPAPTAPRGDGDALPATDRPRSTSFELGDRGGLVLPGPIVFATGTAELDLEASQAALWYVHDYLVAKDYITLVRIEGHADQAGEDALMMTGERALAVGRWLVAQGISCDRLLAAAFGDQKPIADNATTEGRARNRRIDVVNAALRGKAIGGMPVDGGAPAAAPVCD